MSTRTLEKVDGGNWRDFLAVPVAVLMLGKRECEACKAFTTELEAFVAQDTDWERVRFGKMTLDEGGLVEFKRASPWLADMHDLPYVQIYVDGERWKDFAGGGIDRLVSRLKSLPG